MIIEKMEKATFVYEGGDIGIKGFEILFQEKIDSCLQRNGINVPWFKAYKGRIFMEVWELYKTHGRGSAELLIAVVDYYDEMSDQVEEFVRQKKHERAIQLAS